MFNGLFFSFLPLEIDLKSFESEVPIPKDAVGFVHRHRLHCLSSPRTGETYFVALFLECQCFIHSQSVGIDDLLRGMIYVH